MGAACIAKQSETSPSVDLSSRVLGCVSADLDKDLFGVLEILPGALGSDIDTAVGVAGPAVLAGIEEVVGVRVVRVLQTVPALAVEEVLGLEGGGDVTCAEVVVQREGDEEGDGEAEDAVDGHRDVLLGDVAGDQEATEGLQEGATVHGLVEVEAVVGRL